MLVADITHLVLDPKLSHHVAVTSKMTDVHPYELPRTTGRLTTQLPQRRCGGTANHP
jgi:hypothetical protein